MRTIWGIGHYSNYTGFESIKRSTNQQHIFLKAGHCLIPLCSTRVYTGMTFDEKAEKCQDCKTLSKKYEEDEIAVMEIQELKDIILNNEK